MEETQSELDDLKVELNNSLISQTWGLQARLEGSERSSPQQQPDGGSKIGNYLYRSMFILCLFVERIDLSKAEGRYPP